MALGLDASKLKPKQIALYAKIFSDIGLFASTFLRDPKNREQPIVLNYVQQQFLCCEEKRVAVRVHRRGGKSYGIVIGIIHFAVTHPGCNILVITPDKNKIIKVFDTLDNMMSASPGFDDMVIESQKYPAIRKLRNGAMIKGFTTGARTAGEAEGIRGEEADLLIVDEAAYLAEGDWPAIEPIMVGDAKRKGKVKVFIVSTPTDARGPYYHICTDDQSQLPANRRIAQIHIPITENPEWTTEDIEAIRTSPSMSIYQWTKEYLADFPDIGEGVFKRSYIDRCKRSYEYDNPDDPCFFPESTIRTIGVDWDKYNGVGPNIIVLEKPIEGDRFKVCYHEEIEPTEYCLTLAVERLIFLNKVYNPAWMFVDRGYGEMQLESLHKYGLEHKETGLARKVVGISLSDRVEVVDPTDGLVKKPIKPYMINVFTKMLEDDRIVYPKSHEQLITQLQDYKVVSVSSSNITYSSENEHIIDALCLATYAMFKNFEDPFAFQAANRCAVLPVPEVIPVNNVIDEHGEYKAFGAIVDNPYAKKDFGSRGNYSFGERTIADVAPMRRGF